MADLWEAQQQLRQPATRSGRIRALQENAALFSFLQSNGIQSMEQLHEKLTEMNTQYYDLRGEIVKLNAGLPPSPSAGRCGHSTASTGQSESSLTG